MVSDFNLLTLFLVITILGIISILFIPQKFKAPFTLMVVIINATLTTLPAIHALSANPLDLTIYSSFFIGNIPLKIDALATWFILIINITTINGAIYGWGYMKQYADLKSKLSMHWMMYLLFHSSMLSICMIRHGIAFLIAWEIMSLSSLMLVLFDQDNRKTLKAGINYLVQMHISVMFLTIGFIWVYFSEGSFDFAAIHRFFGFNSNIWLFLVFFTGFGIKAGFIPLHTWLPKAHPAAPSHISGVMSGVIVKLGIYGILRIITFIQQDYLIIGEIIITISVITGVFGILNASVHRDFKKMLAYCTIENIGIIGTGIGVGLMGLAYENQIIIIAGFGGALLHTLNHSLFKSLLFFSAGSVYQKTHTRNMEALGGLIKKMPQTAILFLIGALAIGGLPPFNGFISEFLLYSGYLEGIKSFGLPQSVLMIFTLAGLAIIGGISLLTFTKTFGTIFLGTSRKTFPHEPTEVSLLMRAPQYIIIAIMLFIGIFPQLYFSSFINMVNTCFYRDILLTMPVNTGILTALSNVGIYSALFLVLIILVIILRNYLTGRLLVRSNSTWGCGYINPTEKMQYTSKSFSKSMGKLVNFFILEKKKYTEIPIREIFPVSRNHSSHYLDFFEKKIINPLLNRLMYSMNYFQFIQNGKIQAYVLYGIIFIVLIFLGTIFNLF